MNETNTVSLSTCFAISRTRFVIPVLLLLFIQISSQAHEVRPGYLDVNETGINQHHVTWKVPSIGGRPLPVEPRFPTHCEVMQAAERQSLDRSVVSKATVLCQSSLAGATIEFAGLDATLTDVLVRVSLLDGELQALRATPDNPVVTVAVAGAARSVAETYFVLGVEHILLGIDHLLFVFALVLIIKTTRRLVATITAFTLAHSITLVSASLGWVNLPGRPVEAVIALSIVFLASEIANRQEGVPSQTERRPWIVAFLFGLLHGFGFAGALTEIGLPNQDVPTALLTFNLGVEAGQLLFLGVVLALLGLIKKTGLRDKFDTLASYVIGTTASFWLIERLV